jgi:hypothetical protein
MLTVCESTIVCSTYPSRADKPMSCVRPSLVDLRFTGDPWVQDQQDGSSSVLLDNYRLVRVQTSPFDLPSLNRLFLELRLAHVRRRLYRQLRSRRRAALASS